MPQLNHPGGHPGGGPAAGGKFVPRLVFWELTSGCNLRCQHCRASAQPGRLPGELETEQIFQVIEDIAAIARPIVVLTGGEPLYRDDVFAIADRVRSRGMHPALATNGTLIDGGVADRIKEAGIERVSISIDGGAPSTHDGFRGILGSFGAALEGARRLRERGVEFQFNSTITRHNVQEISEILALSRREGARALHIFMLVPVGCGVQIADDQILPPDEYERVLNWFYDQTRQTEIEFRATCAPHYYRIMRQRAREEGTHVVTQSHGMAASTKGCLAGTGVCFISSLGQVQPCGYLPVKAGNVLEQPFGDIWLNSPVFADLRDPGRLRGKCGICEYRNVCYGCRARAYAETGDYLGEEPHCIYVPRRAEPATGR